MQEGDVDWEEAAVAGTAGEGDDAADLDDEEEDGGLTAYAAGAANAEQVRSADAVIRCI